MRQQLEPMKKETKRRKSTSTNRIRDDLTAEKYILKRQKYSVYIQILLFADKTCLFPMSKRQKKTLVKINLENQNLSFLHWPQKILLSKLNIFSDFWNFEMLLKFHNVTRCSHEPKERRPNRPVFSLGTPYTPLMPTCRRPPCQGPQQGHRGQLRPRP